MLSLAKKLFGTANDRAVKKLDPIVSQINALESRFKNFSDHDLKSQTSEFKNQIKNGKPIDDVLPEAFAVVREASKRTLNMRHFDVQLIGGLVLHHGRIAEMKTGEGKTLMATLPVYLNALTSKGVHVVTVNDYLASRDAEWMGRIYHFLGLTVGTIIHGLDDRQRKQAYASDVTYGTNNEFGFDFLRDNMKFELEAMVQRSLHYAIVDEVDSILIDEARTPLIISGQAEESTSKYSTINRVIPGLKETQHYQLDEKSRTAVLTEEGVTEVEKRLQVENLFDPHQIEILHHVNQALKAHTLYKKDVDYVVKDGKVMIVDEFTGRLMPGRRWSDGLHQAVEAKEGVTIENENQTLASITFQNYFRMYKKLSGMTGTADTEAEEFHKIYNLDVMVIPTNQPMVRKDLNDIIYKNQKAKFNAVVEEIKELNQQGRPVLVGTIAIEKSEVLSELLKRKGIKHNVLNAKHHSLEADIVAQAGRLGGVTVSTNMAGRGTDIKLGGNPEFLARNEVGLEASDEDYKKALKKFEAKCEEEAQKVKDLGGLAIIGTERHESRRIDNQLRGRAGRQGDNGSSRFYVALDDDLMRIFGSDRIANVMERLGMKEDENIEHKWISKAIENAQKKVEAHNFEIRKTVLEYDDVMNQQRQTIYEKRREILEGKNNRDKILDMIDAVADRISLQFESKKNEFNKEGLEEVVLNQFGINIDFGLFDNSSADHIGQKIYDEAVLKYDQKEKEVGENILRQVERFFMLQILDQLWKDHLLAMDHLREGIGLRGYGQKDPKLEYKKEGFQAFEEMIFRFFESSLQRVFLVQIEQNETAPKIEQQKTQRIQMRRGSENDYVVNEKTSALTKASKPEMSRASTVKRDQPKVGRNDPCYCGSGKKFKKCHGV